MRNGGEGNLTAIYHKTTMSNHFSLSNDEFDDAIVDALGLIPSPLQAMLDNVVFLVADEPPDDEPELLGVYDGIPLTERGDSWGGDLPDRITLFRGPLRRMCASREELVREVGVTVLHEVAHYFGIDEGRVHALGWG